MKGVARFVRNVTSSSQRRRLSAIEQVANRLIPDFRLTWHYLDWWHDPDFNDYLNAFGEQRGFNSHRRWMVWQLIRLVKQVVGDTAECGVFEGSSSWLICAATRGTGRKHHLFDSFEGLSTPDSKDGAFWKRGELSASVEVVRQRLKPFENSLVFHKGWIPDRFASVADTKFAFVHIDVDLYQPTRDSIEFFYSRLSPGGVLLCDDYGCTTCPGATEAIDTFLADKPEKMVSLDAGGGFIIKGISTASTVSAMTTGRH